MNSRSPAPVEQSVAAGIPVEIGKIDRELKKLWEQGGEMMARASLINLALYSEAPDSLERNTQLIAQIAENHACRALVIAAEPAAENDRVEAWIGAHCHVSRAGSKHICSEQLSFRLRGTFAGLLPNIVFSHLDSDLPFYFWWQGEFCDPMDPQLWSWVDRLIYDSSVWQDAEVQLRRLETAQAETDARVVLCDLNWTRLIHLRLALAQFFDSPATRRSLTEIDRVEIEYAPEFRSTALLLVGWLAAQLGWKSSTTAKKTELKFARPTGREVYVELRESAGEAIRRCSVFAGKTEYRVSHRADAGLLETISLVDGRECVPQLMPASSHDPAELLSEELMRGGSHRIYLRALEKVRSML